MKAISSLLFTLACCTVLVNANSVINQLTNALIANTDINSVLNNQGYGSLNFNAPAACSQTQSYPATGSISSLTICYATSIAYPYRNATAGYEVSVTSTWGSLLSTQYGSSFTYKVVGIPVESDGLFPTLQRALAAGTCDTGLTSLFLTTARAALLQPSCSYGSTFSAYLIVTQPASGAITSDLSTLNRTDVTIAVGKGTASLAFLQNLGLVAKYVLTVSTTESINTAVNGTANVAIGDAPVLSYYASTHQSLCSPSPCPVYQLSPASQLVAYTRNSSADPTGSPTASSPTASSPTASSPTASSPTSGPTSAPSPSGTPTVRPTTRPATSAATLVSVSAILLVAVAVVAAFM